MTDWRHMSVAQRRRMGAPISIYNFGQWTDPNNPANRTGLYTGQWLGEYGSNFNPAAIKGES